MCACGLITVEVIWLDLISCSVIYDPSLTVAAISHKGCVSVGLDHIMNSPKAVLFQTDALVADRPLDFFYISLSTLVHSCVILCHCLGSGLITEKPNDKLYILFTFIYYCNIHTCNVHSKELEATLT